jgi:alkylation response protein AidB-like acyl-CoA dehydrogenase
MSLFLVDTTLPGFKKGNPLKKAGLKAQDTCELFFEDVVLPADALLGEEGRGFKYLMEELPQVTFGPRAGTGQGQATYGVGVGLRMWCCWARRGAGSSILWRSSRRCGD